MKDLEGIYLAGGINTRRHLYLPGLIQCPSLQISAAFNYVERAGRAEGMKRNENVVPGQIPRASKTVPGKGVKGLKQRNLCQILWLNDKITGGSGMGKERLDFSGQGEFDPLRTTTRTEVNKCSLIIYRY